MFVEIILCVKIKVYHHRITKNCILADYSLLCRLLNDPYDVMGCWCTDNYFISGTMEWDYQSFDASIWLCSPPTLKTRKNSNITNSLDGTYGEESTLKENIEEKTDTNMDCDINQKSSFINREQNTISNSTNSTRNVTSPCELQKVFPGTNEHVVVSWYKKQLLKFRNLQVNCIK